MVENKELDESSSSSDPMATALETAKPIIAKISLVQLWVTVVDTH